MFLNRCNRHVYPKGARIFSKVSTCGVDLKLSILAIAGCFTPLSSANSLWEYPFFSLTSIILLISSTSKLIFRFSSGVTLLSSAIYSSNVYYIVMYHNEFIILPIHQNNQWFLTFNFCLYRIVFQIFFIYSIIFMINF